MFRYRKLAVAFAAVILMILLPIYAFSGREVYKTLASQSSLPAGKEFVIKFDKPISKDSLRYNVYVLNSKGNRVSINVSLSSDLKDIIIKPVKPYQNSNRYTLYIRKNVKYTTGKTLAQALKLSFDIAPYKDGLPVVASRENLIKLLEKSESQLGYGRGRDFMVFTEAVMSKAKEESTAAPASAPNSASGGTGDYSATNIQVQGVDEADIVKTDGEFIFQVNRDRVVIAKAYPAEKLQIIKTLEYNGTLQPIELYVDERHLIVIGYSNLDSYSSKRKMPIFNNGVVTMKIYDITNKSDIKELREIQLEGSYLSSRKVDSEVYLITNKHINSYTIKENTSQPDTPMFRDSALGQEFSKMDYKDIKYFPDSIANSYMVVAGLSLDTPKEKLNVDTYLGAGQEIYCSPENLYAAVTVYNHKESKDNNPIVYDSAVMNKPIKLEPATQDTLVYRFALNRGKLEYVAKGTVPGRILNQFSMDEHDNSFRIATTTGEQWAIDDNLSQNNLYILDYDLKQIGKIEEIAPGEKIYSVRFMGDRAYMVTFRTVDPLFVIDLRDKTKPAILGALKIPGYSDYLHPYDENHVIGFGKDTVEIVHKDNDGNEMYRNAYYLGMKIAMFDITDVTKPKELFVEKLGDRGTDSPLLHDHKALLFSKEKNLLAFPVTLMKVQEGSTTGYEGVPAYGQFEYQGAYVYHLDLQRGFQLRARITHMTDEEYQKAGQYGYHYEKNINRILYLGKNLYTLSNQMIKVHDMQSFKLVKQLEIK